MDDDSAAVLAYVALLRTDACAPAELDVGLGDGLDVGLGDGVNVGLGDGLAEGLGEELAVAEGDGDVVDPDWVSENESV